jgi:hypothetical protein
LTIARLTALAAAALAVLACVPFAIAAALPGSAKYAGKTDDAGAVTLRLNSDGDRVKKMRIHYEVTCDDGRSGKTYTDILNPKIRSDSTFRGSGTYKGSGDGSENAFKVTGKVSARKASGTFSLIATSDSGAQGGTLRCKTGKLTWKATRQR